MATTHPSHHPSPSAPLPPDLTRYQSNPFQLFRHSWQTILYNLTTFVIGSLIILGLFVALSMLFTLGLLAIVIAHGSGVAAVIGGLIGLATIVGFVTVLPRISGFTPYVYLLSARGEQIDTRAAFEKSRKFGWRLLGFSLLYSVILVLGFIFFIIPGVLMMTWYAMAPMYIVDQNMGVIEAMKASKALGKGRMWDVFGVVALPQVLGGILGIVPLLGALAQYALVVVYAPATTIRYLMLKSAKESGEPLPPVDVWNYGMLGLSVVFGLLLIIYIAVVIILTASDPSSHSTPGPV